MRIRWIGLACFCFLLVPSPTTATELLEAFGRPELVADIHPGAAGSVPRRLWPVAGGWVFEAFESPTQLWRTDGTPGGTYSIDPPGVVYERILEGFPGPLQWFVAQDEAGEKDLWRTDGTVEGTVRLVGDLRVGNPMGFDATTGLFFFNASREAGAALDYEPWVSDGTPVGTRQLAVGPGTDLGIGSPIIRLGNQLYFLARGPQGPTILWATDGTPEGTRPAVVPADGEFQRLWRAGSSLYLRGGSPFNNLLLWRSDGTPAGTVSLEDFSTRGSDFFGFDFVGDLGAGKTAWAVRSAERPESIWATDGTPGGAQRLLGIKAGFVTQSLRRGSQSYFLADDQIHGVELWRTDGTPAGTQLVVDYCPGACDGFFVRELVPVAGDRFLLTSALVGNDPVVSAGTAASTAALGDLCPGACSAFAELQSAVDLGGAVVFTATPGPEQVYQLWATDLTPKGTVLLSPFATDVSILAASPDQILVRASDSVSGAELWRIPVGTLDPLVPAGPWHSSAALPGFEAKVRIGGVGGEPIAGRPERSCIDETLCFSGAVSGRTELFVRVVGPKPNGRLWPTLVRFTTSSAEVWIRQVGSGVVRYYELAGARPGVDELPGLFDREGFVP